MPTGIKAPEYRLARIGADAAPPMFAIEDIHSVNMSSRKMRAINAMRRKCTPRMMKPASTQAGASPNCSRDVREAMSAMSE